MKRKSAILKVYEALEQEATTSPEYKELIKKFNKLSKEFTKDLTESQKLQYEKILKAKNDMESDEVKNWFIRGYETATTLIIEGYKKENKK